MERAAPSGAYLCMLNFFREHSRTIRRLNLYQFGAAFLAICLGFAVKDLTLFMLTSVFSVLFLLYLNHTVIWEEGAKNRIRVDAGRAVYNPLVGLWIGIAASLPNLILGVLTALFYFLGSTDAPFAWEWAGNTAFVIGNIAKVWQFMYFGIIRALVPNNPYIFLVIPFPTILACFFSYWLGLKQWRFPSLFKLKKEKDAKK